MTIEAMEIEVGKYYKRRDGQKSLVVGENLFVGRDSEVRFVCMNEDRDVAELSVSGKMYDHCETAVDLVAEWVDSVETPLEYEDIVFGTAFKTKAQHRNKESTHYFSRAIVRGEVYLMSSPYKFVDLMRDWLMKLPGTDKWVPCCKASLIASQESIH